MKLRFSKYQGIGNDFVVVEGPQAALIDAELAMRICDRHLGVGADGVLLVSLRGERPRMKVINADGSTPEMCGNGLRCVALHLALNAELGTRFTIETDAGPHECRVVRDGGALAQVEVQMSVPTFEPASVPVDADAEFVDAPLDVGGVTVRVTALSMGNPHAVTFDKVGDRRHTLGPALAKHKRFAHGANAGFARIDGDTAIALDVYERGVGWTRACGTGACAAAVAAVRTGRMARERPIAVQLPGGVLSILVGEPGAPVRMTGPAELVFEGELLLHELEHDPLN